MGAQGITDEQLLELDEMIQKTFYFESQFKLYEGLKERLRLAEIVVGLGRECVGLEDEYQLASSAHQQAKGMSL